jgi:hypothetical protein
VKWTVISCVLLAGLGIIVAAFSGSFGKAGKIESVLQQAREAETGATSARQMADRVKRIDAKSCPSDFRSAFLAYTQAWESLAEVEAQAAAFESQSGSGDVLFESMIRGFLGDPFGKAVEIMDTQKGLERAAWIAGLEIQQAHNRMAQIAVSHGAELPE